MQKTVPPIGRKFLIILFWLLVWQTAAWLVHNPIILVGPVRAFGALLGLIPTGEFWLSVSHSFLKISAGFFRAFLWGLALGSAAFRFPLIREFLEPAVSLMKSVPVASFVILALIWAGSEHLSVVISFLVVFPVIYINTLAGLNSTDVRLLEMAKVFHVAPWKTFRSIYFPSLLPYLISGCRVALGISWKSGVAAEVIGLPDHSIGEHLYLSKIYLDTAGLFAWTFVIILISVLFEKLFLAALSRLQSRNL